MPWTSRHYVRWSGGEHRVGVSGSGPCVGGRVPQVHAHVNVVGRSHGKDPRAINELIAVSRSVASAWREITAHAELPWWLTAAVASAAEAFDEQAHQDQAALEYVTPRATQTRPEGGQWR